MDCADGARELVLEGAVVVEVGEPVAARALQGGAVERADAAAAEHVEERQRDQQAQQHEQAEAVGGTTATPEASASLERYSANTTSRSSSGSALDVGVAVLAVGHAGDRRPVRATWRSSGSLR